jgi:hypothetical protein
VGYIYNLLLEQKWATYIQLEDTSAEMAFNSLELDKNLGKWVQNIWGGEAVVEDLSWGHSKDRESGR